MTRAKRQQSLIAVRVEWPDRPKVTFDKTFGQQRKTWRSREDGYVISQCALPDFTLIYPPWAEKRPTYHRTLKAAKQAADDHRNQEQNA